MMDKVEAKFSPSKNQIVDVRILHLIDADDWELMNEHQIKEFYTLPAPEGKVRVFGKLEWEDIPEINEAAIYIANYDEIDSIRRQKYQEISDPLYIEAWRKESKGLVEEAAEFRKQADAAVELIQAEHPWPTPPEA